MRSIPLFVTSLLLVACNGPGSDAADSGDSGDNGGDSGDTGSYAEGCITVDGGGGYALLADALTVAPEGATIELCAGDYAESVEITKPVTLVGAPGALIIGQGVDPAIRVSASDVTISSLAVSATYSGIVVGISSGVSIDGVVFSQPEYWGLQLQNATDVTVTGCTFDAPGAGGVDVNGGSATISGNTFTDVTSFGVRVSNNAVATVSDNEIDGVIALSEDVTDGHALSVTGATLTTSGNTMTAIGGVGVYSDAATLTMSGDSMSDIAAIGAFLLDTPADLTGVSIDAAYLQGIYVYGTEVSLTDVTITVDPAKTGEYKYARWGTNGNPWFGGAFVIADVTTLTNVSVSGYNNYGVLLVPNTDGGTGNVTLDGVSIDNVGRWGFWVESSEVGGTGLHVSNLREPELDTPCTDDGSTYSVDRSASVFAYLSRLDVADVQMVDNQGWGLSLYQGTTALTGSTFDNNACAGIINFAGLLQVEESTFTAGAPIGSIWDYQGHSLISGNTFTENHRDAYYGPYDDGAGGTYAYYYSSGQGQDVQASGSVLEVTGNTFVNGDQSLTLYESEAVVTDNTWTGYDGWALYAYLPPSGSPIEFARNTLSDQGGYVAYAYAGELQIEDLVVDGMRPASYDFTYYNNDEVVYSYTSSTNPYVFYMYASSGLTGALSIDGAQIDGAQYGLGYSYDNEIAFRDVFVGDVGATSGASMFTANWSSVQPVVDIDGLAVGQVGGTGLSLSYSGASDAYVTMANVSFERTGSSALYLSGMNAFSLTDASLGTAGSYGLYARGVAGSAASTIERVTVDDAGSYGMYVYGGALTLTDSSATSASYSGLKLDSTTATVTGNAFTGNGYYGMECASTTLDACSDNDLSGNAWGEQSGCLSTCSESSSSTVR